MIKKTTGTQYFARDWGLVADAYNGNTRTDFEASISTNNVPSHHLYLNGKEFYSD